MKRILFILLLILAVTIVFSLFFWFYEAKYFVGRASVSQASFSVENSYLFVSPLKAKANGSEKIRVTIFVLNNQGLGVMGKAVHFGIDPKLNIEIIQGLTDNFGKAIFDISSTSPAEYYLEVKVEDTTLPQKAHLSFN